MDLWGILLNPGASSHAAGPASEGKEARPANVDAGIIIANNIITDFGYGHEFWNWGGKSEAHDGSYAIAFLAGQLESNPPLTDILVQGNLVYDTGRDGIVTGSGEIANEGPRYKWAVCIEPGGKAPVNMRFEANLLRPGTSGIANVELPGMQ